MLLRGFLLLLVWLNFAAPLLAFSLLTYNVNGNGATDWSTNSPQVQAIGRQMLYLRPDIVTFQEIPFTNTHQMPDFVKAFLPGYALATNSGTDGFVRSVIASRHPVVRSQKWLDGVSLANFGYNGNFTRDLFEAEISVPNYAEHLHVFTTHLKAQADSGSAARRAAEASAISNFFVTVFLPTNGQRPYVLTGDLNEDIRDQTISIRASLGARFDYILPGGLLFSNISTSQVFRTDLLSPVPPSLQRFDDKTASDHLPVWMAFNNPYDTPFRLLSVITSPEAVSLSWETTAGSQYDIEASADFGTWTKLATNVSATGTNFTWTTGAPETLQFFRIYRLP